MEDIIIKISKTYPGSKYSLQYADYDEWTWTAPVLITRKRVKAFMIDKSLDKIKIINTDRLFLFEITIEFK